MKHSLQKRVFIVHGYKSYPTDCWFPWLKKELVKRGYKVFVPPMPKPAHPKKNEWIRKIKISVRKPDKNTYLVGHSLGAIAILHYLESLPKNQKIGGMISVGGRFISNKKKKTVENFFHPPLRWQTIRKRCRFFTGIYSKNDPLVSLKNAYLMRKKLSAILILEKNKGHFSRNDNVFKLPVVLKELVIMSNKTKRT